MPSFKILGVSVLEKKILKVFANYSPQGGYSEISVYIGEADFFGVKILNFRIFLGFQKN